MEGGKFQLKHQDIFKKKMFFAAGMTAFAEH